MIRVVIAVLLTAGLLAVSLPALDAARADRATARIDRFAHRLTTVTTELATSETPVRPTVAGAHRVVELRLPPGSVTVAQISSVAVRCHPAGDIELGFVVDDENRTIRVPVPVPAAVHTPLSVTPTERTLRLGFVRLAGEPTVVVQSATDDASGPRSTRPEGSTVGTGPPTACSARTSRAFAPPRATVRVPVPPRSKPPP